MPAHRVSLFCCLVFLAAPVSIKAISTYTCTVVPINAGTSSFPYIFPTSINNSGDMAGYIYGPSIGFVVDNSGASVPFAAPAGTLILAAINNQGQVAGWTGDTRSPWYPFTGGSGGLQPAQGFLSNPDGSVAVLDPPPDTTTRTFGDIRVNGINDSGDILGEISVTDQGQPLTQYWFIRGADGIYTLFDPHSGPGRTVDRSNLITAPGGSINNSRTAVINDVLHLADGTERPIFFRGMVYPWNWWGINNKGAIAGNFVRYPYTPPFSVLLSPDGNAPAVVCPNNNPPSILAFGVNDDGVIAAAQIFGASVVIMKPTGTHSGAVLSNSNWNFSPNPAGQQGGTGIVYLSSSGAADLNIQSVVVNGRDRADSPADFTITQQGTNCIRFQDVGGGNLANIPQTFAPGEFCTISFSFTPRGVGARTAQISVFDDAPDGPHVIRLNGTGLGKQNLVLSNNSWMAGAQAIGQSSGPGTIYIYNPGTDAIDISSLAFSGANAGDFRITVNSCGSAVAAYTTCAVTFTFTPASSGFRSAVLTLSDDSPVQQQTVPVSGYGF